MRCTLNNKGEFVEKENLGNSKYNFSAQVEEELKDLKNLRNSVDLNTAKKQLMKKELESKKRKAKQIIDSIPHTI